MPYCFLFSLDLYASFVWALASHTLPPPLTPVLLIFELSMPDHECISAEVTKVVGLSSREHIDGGSRAPDISKAVRDRGFQQGEDE